MISNGELCTILQAVNSKLDSTDPDACNNGAPAKRRDEEECVQEFCKQRAIGFIRGFFLLRTFCFFPAPTKIKALYSIEKMCCSTMDNLFLVTVIFSELVLGLSSSLPQSTESLDGYAFDCSGVLIGFSGKTNIHCMNSVNNINNDYLCGEYQWDGKDLLAYSSVTGPFRATSLERVDDLLISFQSSVTTTCNVVSLDWRKYSMTNFLGLKCPIQNLIPGVSYQENHFSFGISGDAALRSPLELPSGRHRQLIRDLYGIFRRTNSNGGLKIYFGPQQGQPLLVLEGILTDGGELNIEGYMPPGPCVHDGTSLMQNSTSLPTHYGVGSSPSSSSSIGFHVVWTTATILAISIGVSM